MIYENNSSLTKGSGPPCPEEGDPNSSGSIDISDLTCLVEYLFQSRAAPKVGCA